MPFAVVSSGLFMILLDATALNVAQASIRESLDASLAGIQWTIDAYLVALTVCLLACGRLGDIVGRRRLFVAGIALFGGASVLCALAGPLAQALDLPAIRLLIGARVLQGVGAAGVLSQSLSLVAVAFPPERRGMAFGMASAIGSLAGIAGPLGGGFLTEHLSWSWIFLINVPIGAAVIVAARVVPESRDASASRRIDLAGIALSGVALFALALGLIEAAHRGWGDSAVVGLLVGSALLFGSFILWERRASDPILKLDLLANRDFRIGNIAMACFNLGFYGLSLPLMVFLQNVRGLTPVEAGMVMAPSAAAVALTAPVGGRLSDRVGPRWVLLAGFGAMTAGVVVLAALLDADTAPAVIAGAMAFVGLGVGFTVSQVNAVPMRAIPAGSMGAGSGLLNTTRMASVTLSVALMTSLLQSQAASRAGDLLAGAGLSNGTNARVIAAVRDGRFDALAGTGSPAEQVTIARLEAPLREAFAQGLSVAMLAAAVFLIAGIGTALALRRQAATEPAVAILARRLEPAAVGD